VSFIVHYLIFNFIVHFEPIMLSLARWDTQHLYLQASALATSSYETRYGRYHSSLVVAIVEQSAPDSSARKR
jgi:hypothetical protein